MAEYCHYFQAYYPQPVAAFVFFLGSLAEINRTPFDLTEAESELAAGYQNDYSGMKWGLFYLGEIGRAHVWTPVT